MSKKSKAALEVEKLIETLEEENNKHDAEHSALLLQANIVKGLITINTQMIERLSGISKREEEKQDGE